MPALPPPSSRVSARWSRLSLIGLGLLAGGCKKATTPPPAPAPSVQLAAIAATPGEVPFVYVSGYRPEIEIFRLDVDAAKLLPAGQARGGEAPSYLAIDRGARGARHLFALDEVDAGKVTAFSIDAATGALTRLNDASSGGVGPAHLSVDATGRWLLVANYADKQPGTIAILPIGAEGRLGAAVDSHDFGPGSMPHFITTDPSNRYVLVPCKGGPYVAVQRFDPENGRLEPADPDRVAAAPGAGPRHLAFHPNRRFAYVINEQALTITTYEWNPQKGQLTEIDTVPTVPSTVTDRKGFSTAEIHVHPSGKWLYASNRGHNSLVQFQIDADSGKLSLVGHEQRNVNKPRDFDLDPGGRILLVANQDGASVSLYRIDAATGRLSPAGEPVPAGLKPSFVGVVLLAGH